MTRPEDISERAWDEARLAVGEWCLAANLSGVDETIVTEGIARAIDAETARCAKIAEDHTRSPGQRNAKSVWIEAIGRQVAQAIRSPNV